MNRMSLLGLAVFTAFIGKAALAQSGETEFLTEGTNQQMTFTCGNSFQLNKTLSNSQYSVVQNGHFSNTRMIFDGPADVTLDILGSGSFGTSKDYNAKIDFTPDHVDGRYLYHYAWVRDGGMEWTQKLDAGCNPGGIYVNSSLGNPKAGENYSRLRVEKKYRFVSEEGPNIATAEIVGQGDRSARGFIVLSVSCGSYRSFRGESLANGFTSFTLPIDPNNTFRNCPNDELTMEFEIQSEGSWSLQRTNLRIDKITPIE